MIDASPKPMYINGEWVFAEGGATFDVINPADQSTVASIANGAKPEIERAVQAASAAFRDRKSTRLNSSHSQISYAVFCLKKKKKNTYDDVGAAPQKSGTFSFSVLHHVALSVVRKGRPAAMRPRLSYGVSTLTHLRVLSCS